MDFCFGELQVAFILTKECACNPIFILAVFKRLLVLSLEQRCTLQYSSGIFFILLEDLVVIALTQHYIFKARFVFLNSVIFVQKMSEVVFLTNRSKFVIASFFYFPRAERYFKQVLQVTFVFVLHAAGKLVDIILAFVYIFLSFFFKRVVHVSHLGGKPIARGSVNFICGKER